MKTIANHQNSRPIRLELRRDHQQSPRQELHIGKKKIEPSISDGPTVVLHLLAAVAFTAQPPNVSTPLLLGAMTLAGIVIGASGRPKPNSTD
jgi:hypothetical protein